MSWFTSLPPSLQENLRPFATITDQQLLGLCAVILVAFWLLKKRKGSDSSGASPSIPQAAHHWVLWWSCLISDVLAQGIYREAVLARTLAHAILDGGWWGFVHSKPDYRKRGCLNLLFWVRFWKCVLAGGSLLSKCSLWGVHTAFLLFELSLPRLGMVLGWDSLPEGFRRCAILRVCLLSVKGDRLQFWCLALSLRGLNRVRCKILALWCDGWAKI